MLSCSNTPDFDEFADELTWLIHCLSFILILHKILNSSSFTGVLPKLPTLKMDRKSITSATSNDSGGTRKASFPLSRIKQKQSGSSVWKGGSGWVSCTDRAKRRLAGRGKPRCHPALSPLRSSMPVCAADCCCVAGQCSHQCLKSTTDQDKLSHSNKLHIPAIIWPQSLTILTCSWFNVDGSTKSWLMNARTWNCNYNTASFVFAGMQIAQSAAICMRLLVKISFHITKENK